MAADNETLKRLLVRFGVDRSDFDKAIKDIRAQLDTMRSKDQTAQTQTKAGLKSISDSQKAILDTTKQTVKARTDDTAEIKKHKTAIDSLLKLEKEELALKKAKVELMQQEVTQSDILIANLQKELSIERTRVALEEARFRAQTTGVRSTVSQQGSGAVISSVRAVGSYSRKAASGQAASETRTVAEQQRELTIEKQALVALEGQLKVQQQLNEAKKLILSSIKMEVAEEQRKLTILERQLVIQKELQRRGAAIAPITAATPNVVSTTQPVTTPDTTTTQQPKVGTDISQMAQTQAAFQQIKAAALSAQQEKVTAEQVVGAKQKVLSEKELLALMQAELNAKIQDKTISKEMAASVQSMLNANKTALGVAETTVRVKGEQLSREEKIAAAVNRQAQQVIRPGNVEELQQKIAAAVAVERMSRFEIKDRLQKLAVDRQELATQQAKLKVLADQNVYSKAEIGLVNQQLKAQIAVLNVEEQQLRTKLAKTGDTLFTRFGSTLNAVMQRGVAGMLGVGGGSGAEGGRVGSPLFGSVGQIAGGMLVGGIGIEVLNKSVEALGRLKEALIGASGAGQILQKEFERITQARGIDPSEMIEKLRQSTRGLVEDTDLYKMANIFLSQNMKVSSDSIVKLIGNTMDLGRSMGVSSDQVMHALQRAFMNPQTGMMQLARVTGINVAQLREHMIGLSRDISPAARASIMLSAILEEEDKKLRLVGRSATTLPELFKQMSITEKNFISDMATAALGAGNLNEAIQKASKMIAEYGPKLQQLAKTIGDDLGKAVRFVVDHFSQLKTAVELLIGLKIAIWAVDVTGGFEKWGSALDFVIAKLRMVKTEQEAVAAVSAISAVVPQVRRIGTVVGGGGVTEGVETGAEVGASAAAVEGIGSKIGSVFYGMRDKGQAITSAVLIFFKDMVSGIGKAMAAIPGLFVGMAIGIRSAIVAIPEILSGVWTAVKVGATGAVEFVIAKFAEMRAATIAMAVTEEGEISGIGILMGGLTVAFHTIVGAIATVVTGIGSIAAGAVALLGPWLIVAAAIAGLAALIYHWRDSIVQANGVTYSIGEAWAAIKILVGKAIDWMGDEWHKFITGTTDSKWLNAIGSAFHWVGDEFGKTIDSMHKYWLKFTDAITPDAFKSALKEVRANAAALSDYHRLVASFQGTSKPAAASKDKGDTDVNNALVMKINQLRAKLEEAQMKVYLDIQKQMIEEDLDLWKKRYETGLVDFADYMAKERGLRAQQLAVTLAQIEQERVIRKRQIDEQQLITKEPQQVIDKQKAIVDVEMDAKAVQARHQNYMYMKQMEEQFLNDSIAARKTYQQEVLRLSNEEIAEEQKVVETRFRQGAISAADYLKKRADLINQQYALTSKELLQELDDDKKSAEEKAHIQVQLYQAEETQLKSLMELYNSADKTRLDGLEGTYKRIEEIFTAQQEIAKAGVSAGQPSALKAEIDAMNTMWDINNEYLELLSAEYDKQKDNLQVQAQIGAEIDKVTQKQVQLNVEIAKAKDLGAPLAGLFGTIASELGSVLPKQWTSFFSTLSKSLDTLSKVKVETASMFAPKTAMPTKTAAQVAQDMEATFERGLKNSTDKIETFSQYLRDSAKPLGDSMISARDRVKELEIAFAHLRAVLDADAEKQRSTVGTIEAEQEATNREDKALLIQSQAVPGPVGGTLQPTPGILGPMGATIRPSQPFGNLSGEEIGTFTAETRGASGALDSLRQSVQRMQTTIETFIHSLGGKAPAPTQTAGIPAGVPHFQEGGIVPDTGLAVVHAGEHITPAGLTSALTAFMHAVSQAAMVLGGLTDSLRLRMTGVGASQQAMQPITTAAPIVAPQVTQASGVLGTWTSQTSTDTAKILQILETHFGTVAAPAGTMASGMTDAKSKVTDSMGQAVQALDKFVSALISAASQLTKMIGAGPAGTSIEPSSGTAPQLPVTDETPAPSTSLFSQIFGTGSTPGVPATGNAPAGFDPSVTQGQSGILNTNLQSATSADAAALAAHTKAVNADTQATGQKSGMGGGAIGGLFNQLKSAFGGGGAPAVGYGPSELDTTPDYYSTGDGGGGSSFGGAMSAGVGALQSGMQIFGSVLTAGKQLMSAQSAGAGVVQGLMSGATIGMQLGGPIGAAVGAVIGPILGGLAGAKNAAMERYVTEIKAQLKGIDDAVQSGNLGLGQALQDLMQIRSVAQSQAGASKKNEKAWKQSIEPQIDAQIQAIQNQIEQVIKNLHQTLEEITQPEAFQPFLSSLDQIIQKYQQFAQAAVGNSAEVANANLFLSKSLQNYLVTLGTQLNDQQQQAIQNALQLIDLQQQQLQLDEQHAQSVYGILTQGVLGRQQTTAQTKGAQIEQLDETYNVQRQQNQEQMDIAKYRYDTEQKIFGLASDRVGLEQQLLKVQETQVDQQVASITALMTVMSALQAGIAGGPSALAALLGGSTGVGGLQGLLELLGLTDYGVQPGQRVATISDVPANYQKYVQYLSTGPLPDIMMLLQQAETVQSVRRMLDTELTSSQMKNELAGAGIPMGADYTSFINWIMSGAPGLPPPPTYDIGGLVTDTGPAIVHQGEYIFPTGTFQQFVAAMGTLTQVINTLAQKVNGLLLTKNLPKYQQGGVVPTTGPAILHAGEKVIPAGAVAQSAGKALGQVTASNELTIHEQILSLAQTRIGMEMQLLQQQQLQTQSEMQRMAMLSDLMSKMSSMNAGGNGAVSSFEGALMKIYQLRGRYGSGGFRTETL